MIHTFQHHFTRHASVSLGLNSVIDVAYSDFFEIEYFRRAIALHTNPH